MTTGRTGTAARLCKLTLDSLNNPTGGTVEMARDSAGMVGTTGTTARSLDNMVVDADGTVVIQEDPGDTSCVAKTRLVNPDTKACTQIFEPDRGRFMAGQPNS